MVRTVRRLAAGLAFGAMCLALSTAYGSAETPGIDEIMDRSFSGKKSFKKQVEAAVKGEKWEDAAKLTKQWAELAQSLPKNDPPKGGKESWVKLSKEFVEQTAAVADAAGKKDARATSDALGKLNKSCKACHDAHQN